MILFGLSVVLAWSPAARAAGPTANLLPNPSFEDATAGGVPGWTSRAWSGQADARWSVARTGRTGVRCLTIRSEKGSDTAWTATVTVQPNTFYRLSGWIKTRDIRGAVGALLNIQNMQHVRTPAVTGTKGWTHVSTVFRTGTTTRLEVNCLFGFKPCKSRHANSGNQVFRIILHLFYIISIGGM